MQRKHRVPLAVVVREAELDVSLDTWECMRRAEEFNILNPEYPILCKFHVHPGEPVELVPRVDDRVALFAPQIVPHAAIEADVVNEAGLVLVDIECQAHEDLSGEACVCY